MVIKKLRVIFKWRWLRVLKVWNALPIRAQGGITVFIPIVAVLISFCFALYGNSSRAARQEDIQRKFSAVRQYSDLLTLTIDAETGERGFMLTGRAEYLEPFQKATEQIPDAVTQLKSTIEAEPGEKPRTERIEALSKIQELINQEFALLKETQNFNRNNSSNEEINEHLQRGKSLMDEIRSSIGAMQNKEATLLAERLEEINSIRTRDYIVIFITLLIGVLVRIISFYLFDKGIVRRIHRLTEYLSLILKGEAVGFNVKEKSDAVGMLEKEIVKVAQHIKNKIPKAQL